MKQYITYQYFFLHNSFIGKLCLMNEPINLAQIQKWCKLSDNYSVSKERIGQGAYGIVYKGYSRERKSIIAVKVVATNILSIRQLQTLKSLSSLDHPSIMGFYGDLKEGSDTYLFLQYCSKGTIADLIKKGISQIDVLRLFREMVEGMCYMNAKKKMHRDFKPENILISSEFEIKICDFGLSQTTNSIFVTGKMGTPLYAAPQVFLIENLGKQGYSWNCDVWSAGLILYEMLMGHKLFRNVKDYQQLKRQWLAYQRGVKQAKISQNYHPLWNYFINYMIQFDSKKRPTFHFVLEQLKKVYSRMSQSIKTKSNMISDLKLQQVSLFINYNISKYQILIKVCEKFTQEDICIHNQFKYACMFMCLLIYNQFAKKFIRKLKYRYLSYQGKQLISNPEEPQVQMFCDRYRFILQHKQGFYIKQLKQFITQKIINTYCKRIQSQKIIKELSLVINLTKRFSKDQVIENNEEIFQAYKSILAPLKKMRDYKQFYQSQLQIYSLVLISMFLEQKFPMKEYKNLNIQKELQNIKGSSKAVLHQSIKKTYDQFFK